MNIAGTMARLTAEKLVDNVFDITLPLWLNQATTKSGRFNTHLGREWAQITGEATLVSQTRPIANFAIAYEHTGNRRFFDAAENGAQYLISTFRDNRHGGYYWSVNESGAATNQTKRLYGHAFVLFGLSTLARAGGGKTWINTAVETWEVVKEQFTHPAGGYQNILEHDLKPTSFPESQNPLMHLFEALLSLGELPGCEKYLEDASNLAAFVIEELVQSDTGLLPELFDVNWRPLPESEGNRIDVGHAFEWAFLLSSGVRAGLEDSFVNHAERFLDIGIRLGLNHHAGDIASPATLDGSAVRRLGAYWEPCEALRALFHHAAFRGKTANYGLFTQVADFIFSSLIDNEHGGWYTSADPQTGIVNDAKGSQWKLDYHQTTMASELAQLI